MIPLGRQRLLLMIAGRIYCNLRGLNASVGEKVRWHTLVQVCQGTSACLLMGLLMLLSSYNSALPSTVACCSPPTIMP